MVLSDEDNEDEQIEQLPPLEQSVAHDEDFFGPSAAQLQEIAALVKENFGARSTEYGIALIDVGNAFMKSGANAIGDALICYEEALSIFAEQDPESLESADAHRRLAATLRRRQEHAVAAQHLAHALAIYERTDSLDNHDMNRMREELAMLQLVSRGDTAPKPPA